MITLVRKDCGGRDDQRVMSAGGRRPTADPAGAEPRRGDLGGTAAGGGDAGGADAAVSGGVAGAIAHSRNLRALD